jgi:hypothetical protein
MYVSCECCMFSGSGFWGHGCMSLVSVVCCQVEVSGGMDVCLLSVVCCQVEVSGGMVVCLL